MKKNGFTLVELIGVIIILGIIVTLGVGAYNSISKKMKETAYQNKIEYIKNAAARYASETGYIVTNVEELIEKGYLEAENREGKIKNPIDNSDLNCYLVTVKEENGNYYGEVSGEEECDLSNVEVVNVNLEIKGYEDEGGTKGKELAEGEWTRKNEILEINFKKTLVNESEIRRIVWISSNGREEIEVNNDYASKKTKQITVEQIMNTSYEVEVIMSDGTKYQAKRRVRIDKQSPVIYVDETEIENEAIYVNKNKKVTVRGSDLNGSGIYGYYIGTNNKCNEVEYEPKEEGEYAKELDNGTYYICLKDKVGNISEEESSKKIEVSRVDKIAPSCVWSGESTTWEKKKRVIELKGIDNESGTTSSNSWTFESGTHQKEKLSYEIKDEAGNTTQCEKEVDVYIDYEAPECKWSGESESWTKDNRSIIIEGQDKGSGSVSSYKWDFTSGTTKTKQLSYTVKDSLGNERDCSKTANVYVDKEAPNCAWTGENNTWTRNNVTINLKGQDINNGSGSTFNFDWEYTSGTHSTEYLTKVITDQAGNTRECSKMANIYLDKEAPSCSIIVTGEIQNGWYVTDVGFSLSTFDRGSGINDNNKTITSNKLSNNISNYPVSAYVKDNVGNVSSCSVIVKRDANAPILTPKTAKNYNYIREDQSISISNYYNLRYSTSSGNISCNNITNINQLPFGLNSVTCTATGGNGKTATAILTFAHQYDASIDGCSSGTYQNGTCHFDNNETICGCSTYNSCEKPEFGVAEWNYCQDDTCPCKNTKTQYYSCTKCTCSAWEGATYNCDKALFERDCRSGKDHPSGTPSFDTVRESGCGSYSVCTEREACKQCGAKKYNSQESSLCGCKTAGSCDKKDYLRYACKRTGNNGQTGTLSGTTCSF